MRLHSFISQDISKLNHLGSFIDLDKTKKHPFGAFLLPFLKGPQDRSNESS